MPRAARIHAPGYVFHIISRCMNREFLIDGPEDRRRYLSLLEQGLVNGDGDGRSDSAQALDEGRLWLTFP